MAEPAKRRRHLDPGGQMIEPPPDPATAMAASRERFDAAISWPPEAGGHERDAPVLALLRDAEVTGIGRVVYSSNAVFLIEFDAADPDSVNQQPLRAIYKPARGERPLWDFPRHSLHLREVACYLLDAALGLGVVPATTLREGPAGPGSVQRFVATEGDPGFVARIDRPEPESETAADEAAETAAAQQNARLLEVATLDVLANNADRKRAHLLVDADQQIWAIDNALSFLPYPRQRTVLIDAGGSPLPPSCAAAVTALAKHHVRLPTLVERLGNLLDPSEVRAFRGRLRELASDPRFPELDPWDGRPFEMW